jgi:mono/diheme cytochrome c family protein
MNRLKRRLIGGSVIVATIGALAAAWLIHNTGERLQRVYDIAMTETAFAADGRSLQRGEHLGKILCSGCHGEDLGGTSFFARAGLGHVPASNLTSGTGGVAGRYGDADWVRAIRYGIGSDGRPLIIMPSKDFNHLGSDDLADLVVYLKSLAPVDNALGQRHLSWFARLLIAVGAFGDLISVENLDRDRHDFTAPAEATTAAYGQYLATLNGCRGCHGHNLTGGRSPDPAAPPAPDITPAGRLGAWSERTFFALMRSGLAPDGRVLSPTMPWQPLSHMSDSELRAIWRYLHSLPGTAHWVDGPEE